MLERRICIACVSDVFTRHLELAPRTAYLEIRRYTPSLPDLYAPGLSRPWFIEAPDRQFCPYCGSAPKWHARLHVYRIESGRATDDFDTLNWALPQF